MHIYAFPPTDTHVLVVPTPAPTAMCFLLLLLTRWGCKCHDKHGISCRRALGGTTRWEVLAFFKWIAPRVVFYEDRPFFWSNLLNNSQKLKLRYFVTAYQHSSCCFRLRRGIRGTLFILWLSISGRPFSVVRRNVRTHIFCSIRREHYLKNSVSDFQSTKCCLMYSPPASGLVNAIGWGIFNDDVIRISYRKSSGKLDTITRFFCLHHEHTSIFNSTKTQSYPRICSCPHNLGVRTKQSRQQRLAENIG